MSAGSSILESTQSARSSAQVPRSRFEHALAELEALGLVRPANVLLAEYLRALTAEQVLDAGTAEQVAAAYNRVRYSAACDNDPQVREAVAALNRIAERLAGMSPQDRQQLAQRVRGRIKSLAAETTLERDTEQLIDASNTPIAPTRQTQTVGENRAATTSVEAALRAAALAESTDSFVESSPASARRRSSLAKVSGEVAAVVALVMFFGGYFCRESLNKMSAFGDEDPSSSDAAPVSARDAWKNRDLWLAGVHFRAEQEARAQRYEKARLAYELLLTYLPDNVNALNNLASVYLTPNEAGVSDPKRALQLTQRALAMTRVPAVLDTAAEAQFRCGNIRVAIRLEGE